MQDKVSIIIPAFNVEAYVERGIESALGQTYENVELVVVDDGSRDGTWSVIERYASDNRVKCARQVNSGVSKARNHALDMATGDHAVFLDSDDWLELDACEQLVRMQREHPNMLVAADAYFVTMNGGRESRKAQGTNLAARAFTPDEAIREFGVFNSVHIGSSCYKLFSMDVIEKNHLRFDENISHTEDGLFVFDYLKGCAGLYYEPIPLWNILERPGSATTSGYTRKMLSSLDAIDQMISRPGSSPDAIAHLEAFRAHEALRVLGLGIDSGDMTEGDRRALLDALADGKVDRARLSGVDKVRLALYPNAPAFLSRAFNGFAAHAKKGGN
ncbi:MAG: hypothetical protein PEGG_01836 [Paraeggerthella hongkongensis]